MRIRKQSRQLPVCRNNFLPCIFQEGGWISREYLEVGNECTVFSEMVSPLAGIAAEPSEQFVAADMAPASPKIVDHVKPEPNAINISRMYHLQQAGDGRDIPEWVPKVLKAQGPKVQDGQEKSKLAEGRQSGKLPSMSGLNFVGKTPKALVGCGQSSSPSVDTEMANVDQMRFPGPSSYLECYTQDVDDNPTRHYVRRGLRNGGDSVTQKPFGENISVEDVFAAISKTNSCDGLPYSARKVDFCNRHYIRSAIPCDSNEDEDHPSKEPEGSLLHSLFLQLLAAGRDGISLRGLFASFESQTSLPRLASNWREKVKSHLKSGPYFEEVKGRFILCEFLVQPSSKRTSKRKESSERLGVQTRRKAYQETHEAVLSESALEFQKLQRQKINAVGSGVPTPSFPMESIRSDLDMMEPISPPILQTKSRKLANEDDESLQIARNIRFGGAIPGSLKAMKARIIAETGVQVGIRCARKDGSNDSSKWQCPMMAMEGHTLCEHHSFLNERKRARYAKARRLGDDRKGKSSRSQLQEKPVAPGVARKQRMKHDVQSPSAPRSELHNCDSDDLAGLDEVASQALLTMKTDILAVENLHQDKPLYVPDFNPFEVARSKPVREGATKANLAPQFFARSPTGRFIAAKKTTVKIPALETETSLGKSNVPSTRPPSIPPLPASYGPRRKMVKNRSLLSIS